MTNLVSASFQLLMQRQRETIWRLSN